ncbi:MAG: ferrochelatase [Flavobacteriaceae bacterium]|nr:MAG: ferrochelatase [Flavobacteriaceae bacterium]
MKKGVLLINLGSPDSPSTKDVRAYLKEFLNDPKVIDNTFVRKVILPLIILPTRPKKSAAAYKSIWWDEGSPLLVISEKQKIALAKKQDIPVEMGMRYGSPSIKDGLQALKNQGVDEVLAIPLYPQYAMSSSETVIDKTKEVQNQFFPSMKIDFLPSFFDDPLYIEALVDSISKVDLTQFDALMFTYHGIPERHIKKTDAFGTCKIDQSCCLGKSSPSHPTCYRHQCLQTTLKVRKMLNLPIEKTVESFQSRLGNDPWLKPYTAKTLEELPQKGIKKIAVIAPAFVSDCLETLEELAMEGKHTFLENGGEKFEYIPCLNDNPIWIDALNSWVNKWKNG